MKGRENKNGSGIKATTYAHKFSQVTTYILLVFYPLCRIFCGVCYQLFLYIESISVILWWWHLFVGIDRITIFMMSGDVNFFFSILFILFFLSWKTTYKKHLFFLYHFFSGVHNCYLLVIVLLCITFVIHSLCHFGQIQTLRHFVFVFQWRQRIWSVFVTSLLSAICCRCCSAVVVVCLHNIKCIYIHHHISHCIPN